MELTPEQLARIETNRKQAMERRKAAEQQSEAAPKPKERLRASKMTTGYYEYNLSTMRDTRAGFIEEDQPATSPEKRRKVLALEEIPYDPDDGSLKCEECGTIDLDVAYLKVFKTKV
ncbi:DNA repair protein rad14, partial [Coemansia sp. RSA 2704]